MEVLDAIDSQCFCHSFLNRSISWDKMTVILNSSLHAPRAGKLHHLRFVLVVDQVKKEEIAKAAVDQLFIAQAPVLIAVCVDKEDLKKYYPKRCDHYAVQDAAVAVQNIFLTAVSMGINSHWVRVFDEDKIRYLLKLPDHVSPESIVAVGYTDQILAEKRSPQLDSCTYFNDYGTTQRDAGLFPVSKEQNIARVKSEGEGILHKVRDMLKKRKRN